jgi:hypothetical protein
MIDFRYHLVSIVAVFLALAIGIVLGATQLQPLTQRELDNQSSSEEHQIDSLHSQNRDLQSQLRSSQAFATANAPYVLAGQLTGQRVVLVTAPGADGSVATGVTTALTQAGAKVTGQVALQQSFFDTTSGTETTLASLARRLTPADFIPPDPPAQLASDGKIAAQLTAAQVMATALVTQAVAGAAGQSAVDSSGLTTAQADQILSGFASQGFLQLSPASGPTSLATLAVVVIPSSPPQTGDTDPANLALISVADLLRMASRAVVVAGSLAGSGPGSAIDELINGNTGAQLASVDDADYEQGQVMVAQVLAGLLAGQKPAAYGVGPQTVPTPVPAPSATATPAPSKTPAPAKSSG